MFLIYGSTFDSVSSSLDNLIKEEIEEILTTPNQSLDSSVNLATLQAIVNILQNTSENLATYIFTNDKFNMKCSEILHKILRGDIVENREEIIGHLLTLMSVQKEMAFSWIPAILTHENCKDLNVDEIKKVIEEDFSKGLLHTLSNLYYKRYWLGHTSFTPSQSSETFNYPVNASQTGQISINNFDFVYTEYPAVENPENPHTLVIEVYGGYNIESKNIVSIPTPPLKSNMATMWLNLGDTEFISHQQDQLTETYFSDTHALLLKRLSDFIGFIKTQYPSTKIFLKGTSFGGFFITSYALLQSLGADEKIYQPFACEGLKKHFHDTLPNKVDGTISHAACLDEFAKITLPSTPPLSFLTTPSFMHFNFDDERVHWTEEKPFVLQIPSQYLYLQISRKGAAQFMQEMLKESSYLARGHALVDDGSFGSSILHFIEQANVKESQSDFFKVQQARRKKIYDTTQFPKGFSHKDVEQFLSNLSLTQKTLNKKLSASEILDAHMKNITIPEGKTVQEAHDILMDYVTTKFMWKELIKKSTYST